MGTKLSVKISMFAGALYLLAGMAGVAGADLIALYEFEGGLTDTSGSAAAFDGTAVGSPELVADGAGDLDACGPVGVGGVWAAGGDVWEWQGGHHFAGFLAVAGAGRWPQYGCRLLPQYGHH